MTDNHTQTTPDTTTTSSSTTTTSATVALVTGGNKGLGHETVRRLASLGWTVWLGARDADDGEAAARELAGAGDVRFVQIDVTSDACVADAVSRIADESGRLDVLVNNAGVSGAFTPPREVTAADFLPVFGVNVLGPVRVTRAFLDLLGRSDQPRVVNVSSGMGSFGITTDPERFESTLASLVYASSKAALNMITSQLAKSLDGLQVNAVDPGYTSTDLNGHRGMQTVEEGAEAAVRAATLAPDGPTGAFLGADGPLPW